MTSIVPASLLTEAVLEAMPIGVAVVDADKRIVLFNAAYCASLDLAPNSFPPGMLVADALRVSAYRGVYGPGDPEGQVSAFMATDRSHAGRLRRRTFNGRSFDVLQAPLPYGGYVVCAVETTALVAARTESETALTRINAALATLRTGLATFGPDRGLLFANRRFAELLGLAPDRPPVGSRSPRCWTCWRSVRNSPASTAPHSSPPSARQTVRIPRRHAGCALAVR